MYAYADKARELYEKGKKLKMTMMSIPEIEQKVREATSNNAWGASGTLMGEIALATNSPADYPVVMGTIWKRLNDSGKNWRHVYKGLALLEYLTSHGNARVVDEIRDHLYHIRTLQDFHHIDETGQDRGLNVREKSKKLCDLVTDDKRIDEEREKASKNKNRFVGISSNDGRGGYTGGGGGYDNYRPGAMAGGGSYSSRDRYDSDEFSSSKYDSGSKFAERDSFGDRSSSVSKGSYANRARDQERDRDRDRSSPADSLTDEEDYGSKKSLNTPATKSAAKAAPVVENNLLDFDDAPAPSQPKANAELDLFAGFSATPMNAPTQAVAAPAPAFTASFPQSSATFPQAQFNAAFPSAQQQMQSPLSATPAMQSAFGFSTAGSFASPISGGMQPFASPAAPASANWASFPAQAQAPTSSFSTPFDPISPKAAPPASSLSPTSPVGGGQGWGDFANFQTGTSSPVPEPAAQPKETDIGKKDQKDPWAMGSSLVDLNKLTDLSISKPAANKPATSSSQFQVSPTNAARPGPNVMMGSGAPNAATGGFTMQGGYGYGAGNGGGTPGFMVMQPQGGMPAMTPQHLQPTGMPMGMGMSMSTPMQPQMGGVSAGQGYGYQNGMPAMGQFGQISGANPQMTGMYGGSVAPRQQ